MPASARSLRDEQEEHVAPLPQPRRRVLEIERAAPLAPCLARRGVRADVVQPRAVEEADAASVAGEHPRQCDVVGERGTRRGVSVGRLEHGAAREEALAVRQHAVRIDLGSRRAEPVDERHEQRGLQPPLGRRVDVEAGRERHGVVSELARRGERPADAPGLGRRVRVDPDHPLAARVREPVLQRPHLADPAARQRWIAE
jgi:hypothetical protein